MRSERWGVTEMLHEWEPPIHFWLGARSRALSRIGRYFGQEEGYIAEILWMSGKAVGQQLKLEIMTDNIYN